MRSIIFLLLCPTFCSAGQAAENFYVGARLGMAQYDGTANASRNAAGGPGLPREISIDGLPFESDETTWSVYGGWRVKDWLALELGFNGLGSTSRETIVLFGGTRGLITNDVALDVEEVFLASRFTLSLPGNWNANWILGITRAAFDTTGGLPFFGFPPFLTPPTFVPFASPDDETGFIWGFGFGWDVSDRWNLDLGYRRHDTQVLDVDTFDIGAVFSF